jgi:hypothetical protein
MKVFILGPSGTGKTPMATHLATALGVPHVRASAWVRARFPRPASALSGVAADAARQAFVDAITAFATAELRRDPWACLDHLASTRDVEGPAVIEGVRNPFDFVHLYDPRVDRVIWLTHTATALAPTTFERGLDVIDAYLTWLADAGLRDPDAGVLRYRFAALRRTDPGAITGETLDDAIDDAIRRLRPAAPASPARTPRRVHAELPPRAFHVRAEYLHGMDPGYVGELRPCTVFALSSYPGEAPSFQLRLGDGAVFSYVPPSALVDPACLAEPTLPLIELVYFNCPDERICVDRYAALAGPVLALIKQRDLWLAGEYWFTVDWWTGNHVLHAVTLANGQLAMLPSHKLKFGEGHAPGFAPYKKIRAVWKVE